MGEWKNITEEMAKEGKWFDRIAMSVDGSLSYLSPWIPRDLEFVAQEVLLDGHSIKLRLQRAKQNLLGDPEEER